MNKCLACIITYNPNIELLLKNIEAIKNQVSNLLILDNNSNNYLDICKIIGKNIKIVHNDVNDGISKNLNFAVNFGLENNYEWLLTLDQDTICPSNLVSSYLNLYEKLGDKTVASFTPKIINNGIEELGESSEYEFVKMCITSANLIKLDIVKVIGGYDERFFIDYVDTDICANLINSGYKICRLNNVKIMHSIGVSKLHYLFGKRIIAYNHSAIRDYYISRNYLLYMRKYKDKEPLGISKKLIFVKKIIILLYEKNKFKKFRYIRRGIKDFKRESFGKIKLEDF